MTGFSAECAAELQGVRGKMLKLRSEAETANDRADSLSKELNETLEYLQKTEEDRNSLQRQNINLNDQLYNVENMLKEANNKLLEADTSREALITEVKGFNHRLNTMDAAEETYKGLIREADERAERAERQAEEFKRSTSRLQMETDKLENDLAMSRSNERQLQQQLKEAEDRIGELTTSYNQLNHENVKLASQRRPAQRREQPVQASAHIRQTDQSSAPAFVDVTDSQTGNEKLVRAAQALQKQRDDLLEQERFLNEKARQLDDYSRDWAKKDDIISKLENEVDIYQQNHKIISEQLQQAEANRRLLEKHRQSAEASGDQLSTVQEELKVLNKQLTESENSQANAENKMRQMRSYIEQLEKDLHQQKIQYGQLYNKMNETIRDLQTTPSAAASDAGASDL